MCNLFYLFKQVKTLCGAVYQNPSNTFQLLCEIKSEVKLQNIIDATEFNEKNLSTCITFSVKQMMENFKIDCVQYNSHINYLKIPIILKVSINVLIKKLQLFIQSVENCDGFLFCNDNFNKKLKNLTQSVIEMFKSFELLEENCLIFVEMKFIEKFVRDNLLKPNNYDVFIKFLKINIQFSEYLIKNDENINSIKLSECFLCMEVILRERNIWNEINQTEKYFSHIKLAVNVIYLYTKNLLDKTIFLKKYINPDIFGNFSKQDENDDYINIYLKTIFIAKFIEDKDNLMIEYSTKQVCNPFFIFSI